MEGGDEEEGGWGAACLEVVEGGRWVVAIHLEDEVMLVCVGGRS